MLLEQLLEFIQSNVYLAPFVVFALLLLAGLNLPVSEDVMLFVSGVLAAEYPDQTLHLFLGVFLGAYASDLICYALFGRYLGSKIFGMKFFSKKGVLKKMRTIESFYDKYGVLTLFFGRFIPFGVRNLLFITAGLGKMNTWKFALSDLCSCLISCSGYFWLYKTYGSSVFPYLKQGNVVIVSLLILLIPIVFAARKKMHS